MKYVTGIDYRTRAGNRVSFIGFDSGEECFPLIFSDDVKRTINGFEYTNDISPEDIVCLWDMSEDVDYSVIKDFDIWGCDNVEQQVALLASKINEIVDFINKLDDSRY